MKLCKDCRHYYHDPRWLLPVCEKSPDAQDMVTGEELAPFYCKTMRGFISLCGEAAKYYEPKENL